MGEHVAPVSESFCLRMKEREIETVAALFASQQLDSAVHSVKTQKPVCCDDMTAIKLHRHPAKVLFVHVDICGVML